MHQFFEASYGSKPKRLTFIPTLQKKTGFRNDVHVTLHPNGKARAFNKVV
jgi:hypothetical protein